MRVRSVCPRSSHGICDPQHRCRSFNHHGNPPQYSTSSPCWHMTWTVLSYRQRPAKLDGWKPYNPCTAVFVSPALEHVNELLEDLCISCCCRMITHLLHRRQVPTPSFETIHPFVDGNRRTGRALNDLILRRRGLALENASSRVPGARNVGEGLHRRAGSTDQPRRR